MKVVHVCVNSYPYISSWGYQENHMIKEHIKKGHEVTVLTTAYIPLIYKEYLHPDDSFKKTISYDKDGVKIIRLKYKYPISVKINSRLRIYKDFYKNLEAEKPDVIFVHDLQFGNLFQISKYVKKHPDCLLNGDLHVCEENSANNIFSKLLLHRVLYRWIVRSNYKNFHKLYYLSDGCKLFLEKYYGISNKDIPMERLLLGGEIFSEKEIRKRRLKIRNELGLLDDTFMILHSGKLEATKRTHELITAFSQVKNEKLKLYIIGSIPASQKSLFEDINSDNRVSYLGWKTSDELRSYLCAADLYMQPGTQSSTLQTALCCGCPVAVNYERFRLGGGYENILTEDMAYPIESVADMVEAIKTLSIDEGLRMNMQVKSRVFALKELDYRKQIERITSR